MERWRPSDYGAHGQSWAFAQDAHGLLYVGNTSGLLQYDGVAWRLHPTPNESVVRSLALHPDGTLYYGAQNDFGYRTVDPAGRSRLLSLLPHVPDTLRNVGDVWRTFVIDEAVYFHTREALFRWRDGAMRWWRPEGAFHMAFRVGGGLVLRDTGVGLVRLDDDRLVLLPGTEGLADRVVFALLPLDAQRLLVAGGNHPLAVYDGTAVAPWEVPGLQAFPDEAFVYHGNRLSDGRLLLSSIGDGAVVFHPDGTDPRYLTRADGLNDDIVIATFEDPQGGLWMSHESGLTRVALHSPFTLFDEDRSGLPAAPRAMAWHDGRLHTGHPSGLYRMRPSRPGRPDTFEPVPAHRAFVYDLLAFDGQLLVATGDALYQRRAGRSAEVLPDQTLRLHRARRDPARVWTGHQRGLASIRWDGGRWVDEGVIAAVDGEVRWIEEADDGSVWVGTNYSGAYRVTFDADDRQRPRVTAFADREGLPGNDVKVFRADGDVLFSAGGGLYRYRPGASPAFAPDAALAAVAAAGVGTVLGAQQDPSGRTWMTTATAAGYLTPHAEGAPARWVQGPFRRLTDYRFLQIGWGDDGAAWLFASDAVLRYDPAAPAAPEAAVPFPTLLRHVTAGGDTVLAGTPPQGASPPVPHLEAARSGLLFAFAAPRYDVAEKTTYQVRLDGFDDDWSAWSTASQKEYTRLPEGDYTFRVRARDVYGHVGEEATLAFVVLPPWYRAGWAYGLYLLALALGVAGLVQWRTRRLQAQTIALEAVVHERTQTVAAQAERLRAMDRAKSRLFANLSHEFRTPLTLTIGPLQDLLHDADGRLAPDDVRRVDGALRNARRLLRLINQLLDLSKAGTGHLTVRPAPGDLVAALQGLVRAFAGLAERKGVALSFDAAPEKLPTVFDPDLFEKVIVNLLSNAFKFTPSGGAVHVRLTLLPQADAPRAVIVVEDTGVGIAAEQLPHVFDRFYQVEDETTRGYAGTGIGLALVKELVTLHGGTVTARSTVGEGTTFRVTWPCPPAHALPAAEAAEPPHAAAPAPDEVAAAEELPALALAAPPANEAPSPGTDLAAPDEVDRTTVLVVDDNAEIRAYVREHLADRYRVLEAADGAEGLARARQALPDLILSDVMMPRMDGYQLCAAVKADPVLDCIPVILLTARAEGEDKLAGLGTGADDYVTKPFDVRELGLRVDNQIAARRRLRARLAEEAPSAYTVPASPVEAASTDAAFLAQAREVVEAHLDDEAFSVEALADALALSRSQLHRRLKALTDESPGAFVRRLRLEHAAQLLAARAGTVSEVAYAVGFQSLSHFSKSFRAQFDVLPSEYTAASPY